MKTPSSCSTPYSPAQGKPVTRRPLTRYGHGSTPFGTTKTPSPHILPPRSSAVWESVQQTDGTSCGIFTISRLLAITRGWPVEAAISSTLPIAHMRAWLMHVAVSLTDRAPLGACVRCKKRKILAMTHAGANVCIRCLNNTPTLDPHHPIAPKLPQTKHHHTQPGRQQDHSATQEGYGNAPEKKQQQRIGHGINARTAVKERARAH